MTQTPKNETAPEAPLTWTSKDEWGAVGRTYRATVTLDNGDTWKFVVDQPRKGRWTARGWVAVAGSTGSGDFRFYRESRTMKDARAQAQAHANLAQTSTCGECRHIAGHTEDCATLAPATAPAGHEPCDPSCEAYGHAAPVVLVDEGATLLEGVARSGCACPTPTHRMSCGAGARPVVVSR